MLQTFLRGPWLLDRARQPLTDLQRLMTTSRASSMQQEGTATVPSTGDHGTTSDVSEAGHEAAVQDMQGGPDSPQHWLLSELLHEGFRFIDETLQPLLAYTLESTETPEAGTESPTNVPSNMGITPTMEVVVAESADGGHFLELLALLQNAGTLNPQAGNNPRIPAHGGESGDKRPCQRRRGMC